MKIHHVRKTRKEYVDCFTGQKIRVGSTVYRWHPKHRSWQVSTRRPKPSELTTSDKMAVLLGIEERLNELGDPGSIEEARSIQSDLESWADEAQEVADGYAESADNMESVFTGGSSVIDEIREKAEAAEAFSSALSDAANDLSSAIDEWESFVEEHWQVLDGAETLEDLPDDIDDEIKDRLAELFDTVGNAVIGAGTLSYEGP